MPHTEEGHNIIDEWMGRVDFSLPHIEEKLLEVLRPVDPITNESPLDCTVNYIKDMLRTGVSLHDDNMYECHRRVMQEEYGDNWLEVIQNQIQNQIQKK